MKYNSSWFPTDDSPSPASDEVFMTFLVEVRNRSGEPRFVSVDDFMLRTLISGELHEGPTWEAFAQGRTPQLQDVSVLPGQATQKWLTYSIPRALYAEELLWRPQVEDVVFAIGLSGGIVGRVGQALVLGRVTDPNGSPISNFSLLVTPVETVPGIVGVDSVIGKCRGTPYDPLEPSTDELGWYRDTVSGDEFCIDVRPMSSSEIEARSAGYVRPRIPSPIEEIPEVRIDLMLHP